MINFKQFCTLKYPGWLDSKPNLIPTKPRIDESLLANSSTNKASDFIEFTNNSEILKSYIKKIKYN